MTTDRVLQTTDFAAVLTQVLTVTGLLVFAMVVVARLIARWRGGSFEAGRGARARLQVLARLPLRARAALYVVRWDDREILVAATDGGVRAIAAPKSRDDELESPGVGLIAPEISFEDVLAR